MGQDVTEKPAAERVYSTAVQSTAGKQLMNRESWACLLYFKQFVMTLKSGILPFHEMPLHRVGL
jgi:hypothetical protein